VVNGLYRAAIRQKSEYIFATLICVAIDVCTAVSLQSPQSPLSREFMVAVEDSLSKDVDATF
jgi:hypothetical protein